MADYSGSFFGSFQGTISGSLLVSEIVSGSTQIDFNSIVNKPTTIQPFQANSIVSNNRFREVTYPAISASTSTRLTTIETNASTLSTQTTTVSASTSTRFTTIEANVTTLQGQIQAAVSGTVPPGTISSSAQIAALGYLTSASAAAAGFGSGGGGSTDISALNTFTGSIQIQVNNLTSATSSYALKTDVSGAFTSVSSSVSTRLTSLEGTSGGDVTALNLFTGSAQTSLTALNSATSSYVTSANTGSFIRNSQTSSMSVLSALTASFISDIFISASAVRSGFGTALFPSGLLSSSFQIATDISGAFTSLSSSFASRITTLEGAGGGSGIFTLTGSFYSTTNNVKITGSLSVGSGSFKAFEVDSNGFVVLGDMNKNLNTAPIGTVVYSGSNFYLIS